MFFYALKIINGFKLILKKWFKTLKFLSFIVIGIGLVGLAFLCMMSFTMTSYKYTTDTGEPPVAVPYSVNADEVEIYPQIETRGDVFAFVKWYKIEKLFYFFILDVLVGIVFLVYLYYNSQTYYP